MPSSSMSSQAGQFGPNEWLVEEMYQRFLDDPTAVDPAWHDFFADYRPEDGDDVARGDRGQRCAGDRRDGAAGSAEAGRREGPGGEARHHEVRHGAARREGADRERPGERGGEGRRSRPVCAGEAGGGQCSRRRRGRRRRPEEGTSTPLRGAASAVVKNMEASLEVPTATSVRAVPAKLLADNRLVINNQLRRTRGGKISFTHLIGFAVVRALAEMPVMNRHFTERRRPPDGGRPRSCEPGPGDRPARQATGSGRWWWCRSRAASR